VYARVVPRAFSETDRERIRERLRQAGCDSFATVGLRRTAIDDLVRAAGISKGAFYLFFESKEELLQEILEHLEATVQRDVLERVCTPELTARDSLRELLRLTVALHQSQPLLSRIWREEREQLARSVRSERAEALRQADMAAMTRWIGYWRARGATVAVDSAVLTGVLRVLTVAGEHAAAISQELFPRSLETLIDGFVALAVPEEAPERRRSLLSRLGGG
jgi:AcrR family transcriptional regulator